MNNLHNLIVQIIRENFASKEFIPLHPPVFIGNEEKYVLETIKSTFVSSVGAFVDQSEQLMSQITGTKKSIAVVNGTAALHIALREVGVTYNSEVITQSLSFVATSNAISYLGALPVFVDIDVDTMGLSPARLREFLEVFVEIRNDGFPYNKKTNRRISACVPMHTFGFPCRIDEISIICKEYNIALVEDCAESLGSTYKGIHTGNWGDLAAFSFNGNKIATAGGGGMICTNIEEMGTHLKHITTTAKVPHPFEYYHDEIGFNYRLPNLNAALLCAQLEQLNDRIYKKRKLAEQYLNQFEKLGIRFIQEPENTQSNYWLMAIQLENKSQRDDFLKLSNSLAVQTRPIWQLMTELPMFSNCQSDDQKNSKWLSDTIVNIPSNPF